MFINPFLLGIFKSIGRKGILKRHFRFLVEYEKNLTNLLPNFFLRSKDKGVMSI